MAQVQYQAVGRRKKGALPAFVSFPATARSSSTSAISTTTFGLETLKMTVRQPLALTDTGGYVSTCSSTCTAAAPPVRPVRSVTASPVRCARPMRSCVRALKKAGFLTRDPRMKERKKYGLKAARRAPQFSKR